MSCKAILIAVVLAGALVESATLRAAELHAGELADSHGMSAAVDSASHPSVPEDVRWAGRLAIGILGLFGAALVVGLLVRANMPEEMPETVSHDEPPGATGEPGPHGGHH